MQGYIGPAHDLGHGFALAGECVGYRGLKCWIGRNAFVDCDERVLPANKFAVLQIEVEPAYKRPVAAGLENEAALDLDGLFHAVMGMAADAHSHSGHILGKLNILRKTDAERTSVGKGKKV